MVRGGHRHQGPHDRAQPRDRLGARPRPRRRLRQVARRGPRLVDQPQPVLGCADPGVEERRPPLPAHRRLRQPRRARARLRRAPRPTCTARRSTSSYGPTPTTRPGGPPCAGSPTSSTAGSSRARCPSPRSTTPSSAPSGSRRTSPPTSSSSTSPRRGAGSTPCTCWPPRCSTALRSEHCVAHGIVLGDDGRKMSKRLGNYPEPDMVFDTWGADAMRWFLLSSPILRGQDLVVHAKGFEEVRRQVLNPIWNAWYFLSLYANVDGIRGRWPAPTPHGVLDRYILAKTAVAGRRRHRVHGRLRPLRRVLGHHPFPRRPDQLVHPPQPRPVLAGPRRLGRGRRRTRPTPTTRCRRCSRSLCRLAAPLLPLLTEAVYRGLTGERSVHLADWPRRASCPPTPSWSRPWTSCATCARRRTPSARPTAGAPVCRCVRLTVATADPERLRPFVGLIADEVNVKEVVLTDEVARTWPTSPHPGARGARPPPRTRHPAGDRRRQARRLDRRRRPASSPAACPSSPVSTSSSCAPATPTRAAPSPATWAWSPSTPPSTPSSRPRAWPATSSAWSRPTRREAGLHVSDCIALELVAPADDGRRRRGPPCLRGGADPRRRPAPVGVRGAGHPHHQGALPGHLRPHPARPRPGRTGS